MYNGFSILLLGFLSVGAYVYKQALHVTQAKTINKVYFPAHSSALS